MEKDRKTLVLYTSGVCNLNCRYCGIDKNPALKEIDKALAQSFEGDYYFEQTKKYFPNRGQLRRIETWGGEPFLYMDRIYPLLHQIINYYPYYNEFYSSTNFSYPTWTDQLFGLLKQFDQYPYRDFDFFLQLSCDGPEYINDAGRGIGTTQKCLENYRKFCNMLGNRLPENVHLYITVKPTLDINNLRLLNSKNKIIEYYQFFEQEFLYPIKKLGYSNITITPPVPNIAVPAPATKEDGEYFANYCRMCREIENENITNNYFKYYKIITMFHNDIDYPDLTYKYSHHTCGAGNSQLGLMPDGMIATCHEGFTYFVEQYKKLAAESKRVNYGTIQFNEFINEQSNIYCLNEEKNNLFEKEINYYHINGSSARLANIALEITFLAMTEQIDKKYMFPDEALRAAIFMQGHTSYCIKDNFNITGSISLIDYGMIKLFFNGAKEYIEQGANL